MISLIITSYKEPDTIVRAIDSMLNQGLTDYEIIISAPDKETLNVAKNYAIKNKKIKIIKDRGKGKPAALNNIFKIAKGDILVLSDGDVFIKKNSIKFLLKHFKDKKIGAVTARPISTNPLNKMFGYWAHLLTTGFHYERLYEQKNKLDIIASGYYYAIRKNLIKKIPEDILADDAFISFSILKKGYKIKYEPDAEVYVKYPTTLPDWIRQKKRTAGRIYQLKKYFNVSKSSTLYQEIIAGTRTIFEITNPIHILWFVFLIEMRFYLWFRILFDFRLWKRSFKENWKRIETSK